MMRIRILSALLILFLPAATWCQNKMIVYDSQFVGYQANDDGTTCTVVSYNGLMTENRDVVIPETVAFGDEQHRVTAIKAYAFSSALITSIVIPKSVATIEHSSFANCHDLTSVELSEGLESIGDFCFYNCNKLTRLRIPRTVVSLGTALYPEQTLLSVEVEDGNTVYDSRDHCNAIIETATNTLIMACKNTVIPSSVAHIGEGLFYDVDELTTLSLPESIVSVGAWCFRNCPNLTALNIPASVIEIGEGSFAGCPSLSTIQVDDKNPNYDSREGCHALIEKNTNTLLVGCVNTKIPEGIGSIGDAAFYNCTGLTSIDIPNGVERIGEFAFGECNHLQQATIPSSVQSIGRQAFMSSAITNIQLSEGLVSLGTEAFANCRNLQEIVIPSSLMVLPISAFSGCNQLKTVSFPSTLTNIGDDAFRYCSRLSSITLPEHLTVIGSEAFEGCSLKELRIPSKVEAIGYRAFSGNNRLTTIISDIPVPFAFKQDFVSDAVYRKCTLYVPAGTQQLYASTEGWNRFSSIVEGRPSVIKLPSQHAVSDSVGCYNVGGAVCRPERSGVYLVRQSDGSFKKMKF